MRRSDRQVTGLPEIMEIVERCEVCRIALNGDYPYIVPLNFGYLLEGKTLTLYFHGASSGEKLERISADGRAGFEMDVGASVRRSDVPCGCTSSFESVIGFGEASIVTDETEKRRGLSLLAAHYGCREPAFDEKLFRAAAVFKIVSRSFTAKRHE